MTKQSCHPEVVDGRDVLTPGSSFAAPSQFPSGWQLPCRVVPGYSSGGCASFSLASLLPSELSVVTVSIELHVRRKKLALSAVGVAQGTMTMSAFIEPSAVRSSVFSASLTPNLSSVFVKSSTKALKWASLTFMPEWVVFMSLPV